MKSAFRFTIIISLLVHLLVLLPFLLSFEPKQPPAKSQSSTLDIALQPQVTEPAATQETTQPQDESPPPPRHLEDDITKANRSNGIAETKQSSSQPPADGNQISETQPAEEQSLTDTDQPSKETDIEPIVRSNSPTLSAFLKAQAQTQQARQTTGIQSDASKIEQAEEERARWYNEVLKRISEQINYAWVKPQGINPEIWGVIRLNINQNGFLEEAWVHLPSGSSQLDRSALRAIKQVYRYDIPQYQKISHYYRYLEFRYSGKR